MNAACDHLIFRTKYVVMSEICLLKTKMMVSYEFSEISSNFK